MNDLILKLQRLRVPDKARPTEDIVTAFLTAEGFECFRQVRVPNRGGGRTGRVDILALSHKHGNLVIEIDRRSPRAKSAFKLKQITYATPMILLRNAAVSYQGIDGINIVQLTPEAA